MAGKNRFGLSRTIPVDIKYKIRKEAGFGCVVCGLALYEYEHIEPEFCDATAHDPDCMTILCHQCHGRVTRGLLSKQAVWAAKKSPKTFKDGKCKELFGFSLPFTLVVGNNPVVQQHKPNATMFQVGKTTIFSLQEPEEQDAPARLSASCYDQSGSLAFTIYQNEWECSTDAFDIKIAGSTGNGARLEVYRSSEDIWLSLVAKPPHCLTIEQLKTWHNGGLVNVGPHGVKYGGLSISGSTMQDCGGGLVLG